MNQQLGHHRPMTSGSIDDLPVLFGFLPFRVIDGDET